MAVPSFLIRNGSSDFMDRQKNLFEVLNSAEKEKKTDNDTRDEYMEVEQISNKRKRKETKQFRGKESLFKEPVDLPLRFRKGYKVPDFQKNPHKWTKYSLADVTQNEMSNESNTAAALSFLKEIKIQKKHREVKIEAEKKSNMFSSNSHQFSLQWKQEEPAKNNEEDTHKYVFKSSKVIMPEYVVGQIKKVVKTPKKKAFNEKGKEIYLNHIHEYEDE